MTFYAIPSFCAILIKAWLLWQGRSSAGNGNALIVLIGALLAMNAIEFSMFVVSGAPTEVAWFVLSLYYFTAAFSAAAILNLFLSLTNNQAKHIKTVNWIIAAIVAALSLVPGTVVAGVEYIGYSFMRIPGSLYLVWAVYIVSTLLFSVYLLVSGYRNSNDSLQRRRCLAVLVGLLPFIGTAIAVIFLMTAGVRINATVVLSSAAIFFLVALIYSEHKYGLFKLLARVPFTEEYALRNELASQIRKIESNVFDSASPAGFKDQIRKIESLYIDLAIIANDGNKSQAASALGISNATLHRKASHKRQPAAEKTGISSRSSAQAMSWVPSARCSSRDNP